MRLYQGSSRDVTNFDDFPLARWIFRPPERLLVALAACIRPCSLADHAGLLDGSLLRPAVWSLY